MKLLVNTIPAIVIGTLLVGCEKKETTATAETKPDTKENPVVKEDHGDHAHDEVDLGQFDVGGNKVKAAQGHGNVEAGKEGHLVITLPYKDNGETIIRAWIGTADRTLSSVGKGEYAPSHDDYDIHAIAPAQLPANAKWWLEIEKPDGTKAVGSIPLLKDVQKK
jgi:hypothetical protein